jgi:uncharacterized protein DUF2283
MSLCKELNLTYQQKGNGDLELRYRSEHGLLKNLSETHCNLRHDFSSLMAFITIPFDKLPAHYEDVIRCKYDGYVDAVYIGLTTDRTVSKAIRINDTLVMDLDEDDKVIGVEII